MIESYVCKTIVTPLRGINSKRKVCQRTVPNGNRGGISGRHIVIADINTKTEVATASNGEAFKSTTTAPVRLLAITMAGIVWPAG